MSPHGGPSQASVVGGRGVVVQTVVQALLGRRAHLEGDLELVHLLEVVAQGPILALDPFVVVPCARWQALGVLDGLFGDLVHDAHLPAATTGQTA